MNLPSPGLARLFGEIAGREAATARQLERRMGVRPSTLHQMLRELESRGLLRWGKGRARVELHPHFGHVVGIDMGASHLHYALADFRGRMLSETNEKIRPEDGPRKMIAQIKAGIRRLAGARTKRGRLLALAVGVPSPVDPRTARVTFANNLPGWKNISLREPLGREFRVPVCVENDANLAALGEHWRGVARKAGTFVFIALGTGIGSGIFVDGRLLRGRTGSAGEIFRMNVEWPRWNDDFGDTGHFESFVSGMGIAALGRDRAGFGGLRRDTVGLAEERDARSVFEAFHRGDAQARRVLEEIFTLLGVGVANLVSVLDPDLIVIGGGIAKGAPDFMLQVVRRVAGRIQPNLPPVKLSALDENAQTLGAIYAALESAREAICRQLAGKPRPNIKKVAT